MNLKKLCSVALLCGGLLMQVSAQENAIEVYPVPQKMEVKNQWIDFSGNLQISGEKADKDAVALLKKNFKNGGLKLIIGEDKSGKKHGLKNISGSYFLKISPNEIVICGKDGRGTFYGVQTFLQLAKLRKGKLPLVEINDFPDIEFRGTVEGFYGSPWGHEGRKSQIEFYGMVKMNTYIYGPKNDPFHGFSNRWREPYPEKELADLKALVDVAHANKVDFVWAIHPGAHISWNDDSDIIACIKKFEMMYSVGIRSFAVFFDDIGGEGARAEKQVELLNRVNRDFVQKKGDVTPLVMCPTQYNKSWSGGDYLDVLGNKLDKDIAIMWTGNSVCTDITKESVEWINNRIKRKAYIWWNWPVTDYCRTNLCLGKSYGNSKENKDLVSGFVSNPMDKPEASKLGLFSMADYCWNTEKYNDEKSWKAGIKMMFPKIAKEMQLFANHNTDQGPNGHGYRRYDESKDLKSASDKFREGLKNGKIDEPSRKELLAEFGQFVPATKALEKSLKKTKIWTELEFWIEAFGGLGRAGIASFEATEKPTEKNINEALKGYAEMDEAFITQKKKTASDPWSQGCKVATLHLQPLVKEAFDFASKKYYKEITGKEPEAKMVSDDYKIVTNVDAFKNVGVERGGKYVNVKKVFEIAKLEPKQFIGIELPEGVFANYVHIKLDNKELAEKGEIQISQNGKDWRKQNTKNSGEEMHDGLNIKDKIRFVRYINTSNSSIEIKVNQFKLDVPEDSQANSTAVIFDGNFFTSYKNDAPFIVKIPAGKKYKVFGNKKYNIKRDGSNLKITPKSGEVAVINEIIIEK